MEETRNENGQENSNEKVNERKHGIVVEHVYKSFGKEHRSEEHTSELQSRE